MKKVIFLIPTLNMGGGERMVSELSLNLPDTIEKVIVLLDKKISYPYKGKLLCLNVPLSNPFFLRIYYFVKSVWLFRVIVKTEKPDYVVSFIRPANIINVLSGARAVLRVDSFLSSIPGRGYALLTKIFYPRADKIICVSKAAAKDLVDHFGVSKEKVKVIYNFLNVSDITQKSEELLEPQYRAIFEKPVIINVGRIDRGKNQRSLVNIFSEVKKSIPQAQLVILGRGELESELTELIKGFHLEDSVHLLGWQDNPFKFLARASVFVSTSVREGLPYSMLEAMVCGLPVISADCDSGPREILAPRMDTAKEIRNIEYGEFGVLTPAIKGTEGQNEQVVAIREMLNNEKIRRDFVERSKTRAKDFDVKHIIKQWEFLYD